MPTIQLSQNNGIIYTYTNLINGKVYVGRTTQPERRKSCYIKEINARRAINRAMKKYGTDSFEYKIIDSAADESALNFLEQHYIQVFKSHTSQHGYNMTFGGDGISGFKHRKETKRKMSLRRLNTPLSEKQLEHIKKLDWTGRKRGHQTEAHKRKVVKNRLGIPLTEEHKSKLAERISCPHCNKQGGRTAMHRWHFDNCKEIHV